MKKLLIILIIMTVSVFCLASCVHEETTKYNIKFLVDGNIWAIVETTGGKEESLLKENPTKTGYEFDGWYWDNGVWSRPFTANSLLDAPISSGMSVYAKFNAIEYDITYNVDGGTHSNPLSYTIEDSITLSDAEKTGYSFVGWYSDNNYNTKVETISVGTTGDMTLYAKFEIENYTISYTNTKGAVNNNPTSYNGNSDIILANLSKAGYTFDGWYDEDDNKVTSILKGTTGNIKLTAKWIYSQITATFYSEGKEVSKTQFTILDNALTNIPTVPNKEGYEGSWEEYELGDRDISINAIYTPKTYTIVYVDEKNAVNNNVASFTIESDTIALKDLSCPGYAFDGWYDQNNNKVTSIPKGTVGDVALTAKWSYAQLTATFYADGKEAGTTHFTLLDKELSNIPAVPNKDGYDGVWEPYELEENNISINAIYTPKTYVITYIYEKGALNNNVTSYDIESDEIWLETLVLEGYSFGGWYLESTYTTKVESIPKGSFGDKTLYAKLTINKYTISFDVDGGSDIQPITQDYDTVVSAPPKPTKENYSFAGYYADSSLTTEYVFGNMPAENITVYVKWIPYALCGITYDTTKKSISIDDEIVPELFDATCLDTNGDEVNLVLTYSGAFVVGETISIKIVASVNDIKLQSTITGIKVYGKPTLEFDDTVTYFNIEEGLTSEWFKAKGKDTFGEETQIKLYVENEYKAGDTVTVMIESIDTAGNITYGCVENVKAYGLPTISYNGSEEKIGADEELGIDFFDASAKDSFNVDVDVTLGVDTGFVNGEVYTYQTTTDYDYKYFTAYGNETYTLHYKNATSGARTYISVYCVTTNSTIRSNSYYTNYGDYSTMSFAVNEGYEYYVRTYSYGSSYTTDFSMYLTSTTPKIENVDLTKFVGQTINVQLIATDEKGNTNITVVPVGVYGTPSISNAEKTDFKVTDEISVNTLGITAEDSMGENLSITLTVKEGEQKAGNVMTLTATVTDSVGNIAQKDFSIKVYGTPSLSVQTSGVRVGQNLSYEDFGILAFDSFGSKLIVEYELMSGKQVAGTYLVYTFKAVDKLGNEYSIQKHIGVYDLEDIAISYSYCKKINIDSKGEEFNVVALDSFGETCDISITSTSGKLNAGSVSDIYIVARDKAGNEKKCLVEGISIYGNPKITCFNDNYIINPNTNIKELFLVTDSFGKVLDADIRIQGTQSVGNTMNVSITAIDEMGNSITGEYFLAVEPCGYKYTFNDSKTAYILSGYESEDTDVVIPTYINNIPVEKITDEVFKGNADILSVELPTLLVELGDNVFTDCANLSTISFSNSIKSIGSNCFSGCKSTLNVYYDGDVADWCNINFATFSSNPFAITNQVYFDNKMVAKLEIPSSVKKIKTYAFYGANFTSVSFGKNITAIENYAFYNCSKLSAVYYLDSINYWCGIDFSNEWSNPLGYAKNLYSNNTLVTSLSISSTVKKYAFYGCTSIKSVSISGNIGDYAFYRCTGINSKVSVSGSTGESAFYGCTSIPSISVSGTIGGSAFSECASITSISFSSSVSLGSYAFSGCTSLTSATLPSSRYPIGNGLFSNCTKLSSVTIEDSEIPDYCFNNCVSLKSITIPTVVKRIGYMAFYGSGLTSATFKSKGTWTLTSSSGTVLGPYDSNSRFAKELLSVPEYAAKKLATTEMYYTDDTFEYGRANYVWTRK